MSTQSPICSQNCFKNQIVSLFQVRKSRICSAVTHVWIQKKAAETCSMKIQSLATRRQWFLNMETLTNLHGIVFCLCQVCGKNNPKGWSQDDTYFVLCGFTTTVMVTLSNRWGEGRRPGQHAGGAQHALHPSSCSPAAGFLSWNLEKNPFGL